MGDDKKEKKIPHKIDDSKVAELYDLEKAIAELEGKVKPDKKNK